MLKYNSRCSFCDKKIYRKQNQLAKNKRNYCSYSCLYQHQRQTLLGSKNPNYKNAGNKYCVECNGLYKSYNKKRIFCSKSCAADYLWRKRKSKKTIKLKRIKTKKIKIRLIKKSTQTNLCLDCKNPISKRAKRCMPCNNLYFSSLFSKKCCICGNLARKKSKYCNKCTPYNKKNISKTCAFCNKIYSNKEKRINKKYCSNSCRIKDIYGKNNPNFIDGRKSLTSMIRDSKQNKLLMRKVKERDNYKCVVCGKTGNKIETDHIVKFSILFNRFLKENISLDPILDKTELFLLAFNFEPFWDINNLQTLCKTCNFKKELIYRSAQRNNCNNSSI